MQKTNKIWIDAIEFEHKGGWQEDTQFVHLMGSGYLIAANKPGVPVEDATVTVDVPETDTYRIWVRDRNWLRSHNPGKFHLIVNGENNGVVLGKQPSDAWVWEIAGDYTLKKGKNTVALHDLTGYFGRCSSILITNDYDYVPPREMERFHRDRAAFRGEKYEVQDGGSYDVIVVGGGPGGVPAAIASAREGAKVLLIQNRPMLGGNSSVESGITLDGAEVGHINARETGIAEEIRRLRDRDPAFRGDWTRAMETLTAAEKNLTVIYNHHVCAAEMDSVSVIKSVTALNIRTLQKTKYSAKFFVDCTGDAWLGYYAGASYRFGREAQHQYGESMAPKNADTLTMSGCLKSSGIPVLVKSDEPVAYQAPAWVPTLPTEDREFGRRIYGDGSKLSWWLEIPNEYDDMWDGEESRDALLLVMLGYYDHIKNYWSQKERARNLKFNFLGVFNARRESRRLIGDYVLTQDDCLSGRQFDDAVSYSGWHMDIHHPGGIYSGAVGPMHIARHVPLPTIPYRCLYSKNIDNLFMAGRNVSVSHVALGTVRVQNTIATLGQAVGTAAAMCLQLDETPRGIYQNHMKELQQTLIRHDQFIPGLKNEDTEDPCLTAKATASSTKIDEIFQNMQGTDGELIPLDIPRAVIACALRTQGDVNEIYLKLHSALSAPCTVTMHAFTCGNGRDNYCTYGDTLTLQAEVPPMSESWIKFPLHIPVEEEEFQDRCYIQVWLEPVEGISWRSVENVTIFHRAGEMDENGEWIIETSKSYRHSLKKPVEILADCSAENVINGYSRIIDAKRYEWVSDPKEALLQWIALDFKEPKKINSVSVVFDTDLTNPGTCWTIKIPNVASCVKSYSIEVFDGTKWVETASETENFMRKRTHFFEAITAEKIRVVVKETWGDPSARIMEIRASMEK